MMRMQLFRCSCCIFLLLIVSFGCVSAQDVIYDENVKEQYTDQQLAFYETILAVAEKIERSPELKAEWNERVRRSQTYEPIPPVFVCDTTGYRSPIKPTSVHRLMPGDIDVVAAFGDSISAGNGLGAVTLLEVAVENRGEVFSVGGDATLETGVVTFPNIVKKFNPDVKGFSICAGQETYENKAWFNLAEPGGNCHDMFPQAEFLVARMKQDKRVNYTEDWKFLTMFIGGNDLCASCIEGKNYSAERYYYEFEKALTYLYDNMPRTVVNLVSMFDVTPVQNFSTGLVCDMLQWGFCDCARNWTSLPTLRPLQISYHEALAKLANEQRFKRDDFTVIHQPHLFNMTPPIDPATGDYIQEFLSPDCFHPNRIAHQAFAVYLWNTMLIPVGQKPMSYDSQDFNLTVTCPTPENPYIYTDQNSQNVTTSAAATTTASKITTVAPGGTGTNPAPTAAEASIGAVDTTRPTAMAPETTGTTLEPPTAAASISAVDTSTRATAVAPEATGTAPETSTAAASIIIIDATTALVPDAATTTDIPTVTTTLSTEQVILSTSNGPF